MREKIDSSDLEEIPPEILKYVLEETTNQELDDITTETNIILDQEVIIEGEFLDAGEDSCINDDDEVYDVLDSKSYTMSSPSSGETGNSATIIFQKVEIEGEIRVNFGESV